MTKVQELFDGLQKRDRKSIAKAITLVESSAPHDEEDAKNLLQMLVSFEGRALRIGISGPPGVGKSTFIEALGSRLLKMNLWLGVFAIDPSSPFQGGSILGDKIRMSFLASQEQAFIRPSPNQGSLGGVSLKSSSVLSVFDGALFDVVIVETVGVGQSEFLARDLVDIFIVLEMPMSGDDTQGLKKGIFEVCDFICITKSDTILKESGEKRRRELMQSPCFGDDAQDRVICTSAKTGQGLDELWKNLQALVEVRKKSGEFIEQRTSQKIANFRRCADAFLLKKIWDDPKISALKKNFESQGLKLHPVVSAQQLAELVFQSINSKITVGT